MLLYLGKMVGIEGDEKNSIAIWAFESEGFAATCVLMR